MFRNVPTLYARKPAETLHCTNVPFFWKIIKPENYFVEWWRNYPHQVGSKIILYKFLKKEHYYYYYIYIRFDKHFSTHVATITHQLLMFHRHGTLQTPLRNIAKT